MMDVDYLTNENQWKCLKHAYERFHGVCPGCLSDSLKLLCPDCANLRPCGCLPSSSSSSFSSSLSFFDPPRSSDASGIGDVGRIGSLIDGETAFRRSRSAAFQFLRSRSSAGGENGGEKRERVGGIRRRRSLFWFLGKRREEEVPAPEKMMRSTSVAERKISGWGKGWNWNFLNPNFAFSNRKSDKVFGLSSF